MKIKEYSITHYGPLPDTGKILLDQFNLFFGKNEDGKTLTIDAFVKLLLGGNMKDFQNINRVDEKPEGYIIIEDDQGQEIKLSRKKDLTKTVGLTSSECRNIFIIRNSDLSIAPESEFYTNVTDQLTGLRTKEISSIKKKLQELGRLTQAESNSDFSDNEKSGHIKSRLNNSSVLLGEINILKDKIKEERFDLLEEESVKHKEEIEGVIQEVVNLENARKREKYEKGKESLDKLTVTLEKFNHLERYNENDRQIWRDGEKEVKNYSEEKEGLLTALQQNQEEFKETNEKLREVEIDFQVLEDRKKKLDNEIKPELKNYETKSGDLIKKERINRYFSAIGIISAILLGISLLGVIFDTSLPFYILAVSFLILTVISGVFKFQLVKDDAWLAKELERIKLNLSKYGLDAKDIGEILLKIQKFDEGYDKKNSELQDIKRKKENLEGKINELRNTAIPNLDKKMKDAGDKIEEMKMKSGEESLEKFTEKIKSKQELERLIEEQKSILKSHFGRNSEILEESISQWEKDIGSFAEYKEKSREIKYSEAAVSEMEEKKREFEKKLEEINDKMESLQKEMEEVQGKANKILDAEEEYLYCKTSVDLEAVKDRLQRFINKNESNKDNVLKAIKIF